MARTNNIKPAKSATTSSAAGRTAKAEAARSEPVETPDARIKPRTRSAGTREFASESKGRSNSEDKTKMKASARTKTEAEAGIKRTTKATGRERSQSLQPELHARSSDHKPAPALSRKQKDRKPETKGHFATDQPIMAPAELEAHDLPGAPASSLEPSAKLDLAILDLVDAPASPPELSAEADPEIPDLPDAPALRLEPSAKVGRSEKEDTIFRKLLKALGAFSSARQLGRVTADSHFDWSQSNGLDLHPDLAFISFERWARDRDVPMNHVGHVIPDLVVEIIRSSEQTEKLSDLLEAYFRSGVNRVWIIYPEQLKIHDHDSLSSSRLLSRDDTIDGRTTLPGFQLPVKELLAE